MCLNIPCNCQINFVVKDLLVVAQWLPGWCGIGPDATIIPSLLVIIDALQNEVIQLDNVCILFEKGSLWFRKAGKTYALLLQTGSRYHLYRWWGSYCSLCDRRGKLCNTTQVKRSYTVSITTYHCLGVCRFASRRWLEWGTWKGFI